MSMNNEQAGKTPVLDIEDDDQFPVGMRVLALDANVVCLAYLVSLLRKCDYEVTPTTQAYEALNLLKANTFDIVIIDVMREDMDGFKLLEIIGLEMDVPVVMVSANDALSNVKRGIRHGARDYLLKPVRLEEIKNIWQHVMRKNLNILEKSSVTEVKMDRNPMTSKRNRDEIKEEEQEEDNNAESIANGVSAATKRVRMCWSRELHLKFLDAVQQLGDNDAVPKKIVEVMNVSTLTRENVASHLQKYRSMLKKQNARMSQQSSGAVGVNGNGANSILNRSNNAPHRYRRSGLLGENNADDLPKPSQQNVFQNYAQFPYLVNQKQKGMHNPALGNPHLASSWIGNPLPVPEFKGTPALSSGMMLPDEYMVNSAKFLNYNARRERGQSSMPIHPYPTATHYNQPPQMVRDLSTVMSVIPQNASVFGPAQNVLPGQLDGRSSLNHSTIGNFSFTDLLLNGENDMQVPVSTNITDNVQSKFVQHPPETSDRVSSLHPNTSSFMDDDLCIMVNEFSNNAPPRL